MSTERNIYSDEIDLVALFSTLWSGKWLILACGMGAVALTGLWLTVTPPSYEVRASITAPAKADYAPLYPGRLREYTLEPKKVLENVMTYMSSTDQQQEFFEKHLGIDPDRNPEKMKRAVDSLQINQSTIGNSELKVTSIEILYAARSPEQARNTVTTYIDHVDNQTTENLLRENRTLVKQHIDSISQQISADAPAEHKIKEQEIYRLQKAWIEARSLGILDNKHRKAPSLSLNSTTVIPMARQREGVTNVPSSQSVSMLQKPLHEYGTRALSTMIESRKEQLEVDPPQIVRLKSRQDAWNELTFDVSEARVITVNSSPGNAKRIPPILLTLIIGAILGLVTGTAIVLAKQAWRHSAAGNLPTSPGHGRPGFADS